MFDVERKRGLALARCLYLCMVRGGVAHEQRKDVRVLDVLGILLCAAWTEAKVHLEPLLADAALDLDPGQEALLDVALRIGRDGT